MNISNLLAFIKEREAIRLRREAGEPGPWTENPIFREWSFCNVRREDDRVTRWIAANWRTPHAEDPDLWFAMAVARFVNWPDTMAALGFPVPWVREHFVAVLQARASGGDKTFGDAYNISNGGKATPKVEHVAGVLDKLWEARKAVRPRPGERLAEYHGRLVQRDGLASFMAGQIVADLKYAEPLRSASDWMTFATSGPGSKRGLNRVLGGPVDKNWQEDDWRAALRNLHETIAPELEHIGIEQLSASDLQSCLCEFDKFERVRLGEGKPKRRFVPHERRAVGNNTGDGGSKKKVNNLLAAALAYAARGWAVFPVPPGTKKSHKSAAHSNGRAWGMTRDLAEIRRDFARWSRANVGIVTGADNGIFVVEADTKEGHDVDGIASLRQLEAEHGMLPSTLMAQSPSGSLHCYFKHPSNGSKVKNSASELGPGIDVRGDGGMVVAPPSVKEGVGTYRWLNDNPVADPPEWLIALVTAPSQRESSARNGADMSEDVASAAAKYSGKGVPPLKPTDVEKIKAALAAIPADNYQVWYEVGAALHNELGEGGFALFDQWSRKSAKYEARECAAKWKDVQKLTRYSVRTIFHYADKEDAGWRARYEQVAQSSKATQNKAQDKAQDRLILSSAEFVASFVPPDYLIDGLLQRRYVYSVTAPTGAGKTAIMLRITSHVARGVELAGRHVERGRVLYFAGENPDDVRSRWIKQCEELELDPAEVDVFFLSGTPAISDKQIRKKIDAEAAEHGPFSLLIVDTSAAYFRGDNENDNAQAAAHARMMRSFVDLPGGPTVAVTCHPTKNPNMDNLLPRGGGAFVAEVDSNFVCLREGSVVELYWHHKHRGVDFEPIPFKLQPGQSDKLTDSKGRRIWTVTARPITEAENVTLRDTSHAKQDELLALMKVQPNLSLAEMAKRLGWFNSKGEPYKSLVVRTIDALAKHKLVERVRGDWVLTKSGVKAAGTWVPPQAEMDLADTF